MGALFFYVFILNTMYHTSGQNIQILGYLGFGHGIERLNERGAIII
jgi:hypothetical protein